MGKISDLTPGPSAGGDDQQTMAASFAGLGWEVLQPGGAAGALAPVEIDFALAHPGFGVALVDLLRAHPEPVQRLRDRLDAVGFSEAFPGHLPVIHRVLGVDDLWRLSLVLDPGFRSQSPMEIAGREWIALVQRALLLETAATVHVPRAGTAPVETPWPESEPASAAPDTLGAPPTGEEWDFSALPEAEPVEPPRAPPKDPVAEPEARIPPPEPWAEVEPEEKPAIEALPAHSGPSPQERGAWWLLLAAGLAAAIGLSHHFSWPEGWRAGLVSLPRAGPAEPPEVEGRIARALPVAADAAVPAVGEPMAEPATGPPPNAPAGAQNATLRLQDAWAPLPEDEALLLDLFVPLAAPPPPSPEPGDPPSPPEPPRSAARLRLPPAEELRPLPAQLAAAQPAPEEHAVAPRIAEASVPDFEPAITPDPPQDLPPQISPEPAMDRLAPAEAPTPALDPPPAPQAGPLPAEPPSAVPIPADRVPTPMPEPGVVAVPPAPEANVVAVPAPAVPVPPAPASGVVAVPPTAPTLSPAVIAMLIARGDEMLARGDISGARLLYARAAAAGSAAAARAMAQSFEAEVLNRLGVRGIRPDPEQARQWHQRAEEAR
ncbi:hypothetical protein EJV46_20060 [Roseococcus sp. SYP-B2431]|uniref:hypothetical protein n=1 Tax=Roseococcus sp. SYP-B2431 TaxID=2496640 RepID=UPI00103DCFE5|nr:hypothetical protein [Roseococcus sp. SYP-B2431]TCH96281.1 hypothetical protein EJV46_20060 [Roseococcus sp. SYP-B2431]